MIYESRYWKQPLAQMADRIEKYSQREQLTERQYAQYERDVFLGFYTVRKLFEGTAKVSDETRAMTLNLLWFSKRPEAPKVDWHSQWDYWDLYDLENSHIEVRDALFVAHRIVHSFLFVPGAGGFDVSGDFFTSDRDKELRLYFVSTEEVLRLFRTVAHDYPNFETWWDEESGERKWRAPAANLVRGSR